MPTVQVEANLALDQLLNVVEQLSQPDLDQFVSDVLVLGVTNRQRQAVAKRAHDCCE